MDEVAPPTARTRVRRLPERGRYDAPTVAAILDEGLVAHLGAVVDGLPVVRPVAYGRDGHTLYLHGSSGSQLFRALRDSREVCLTVTLLDGVVLARSGFHHSMNYRSVVVYGPLREVIEPAERDRAVDAVVNAVVPGRAVHLRPPSARELVATIVYALDLAEASAKVRTGPPSDDPEDLQHPVWAGVVPVRAVVGEPVPDPHLLPGAPGLPTPALGAHR